MQLDWASLMFHSLRFISFNKMTKLVDRSLENWEPLACRINPFLLGRTLTILPRGHKLQWEFSTETRTISPTAKFLCGHSHFCLAWSNSRYSFDHLFQKISANYCTCLHLQHDSWSSLLNSPGGIGDSECKSSKWLGIKGSRSWGSVETVIIGQPFIMLSNSHIKVTRPLSSVACSWSSARSIFWVVRIHRSQTPP